MALEKVVVAATQMACSWEVDENIKKAEGLVRGAASQGAQIILLQELFERQYFPQKEKMEFFQFATPLEENRAVNHFKKVAKELEVVLPISFFERSNNAYFNTVAIIDADGKILGIYRKTHIPDGPNYEEKYYFNPGDTGFKVWDTRYAKIGVAICMDQWFPEAARIMALMGAEILLYPTAIGSDPQYPDTDQKDQWQRVMQGHAAANLVSVVASNRVGREVIDEAEIVFFGSSFITDFTGEKTAEAGRDEETFLVAEVYPELARQVRPATGFFRERRPEMYRLLLTLDGKE